MTDGFSDPDPSVPDDPEFPSLVEDPDDAGELLMVDSSASCLSCSHFDVCAIYSGIRPMMQDWHTADDPEAEAPIDVERLAWICDSYDPEE